MVKHGGSSFTKEGKKREERKSTNITELSYTQQLKKQETVLGDPATKYKKGMAIIISSIQMVFVLFISLQWKYLFFIIL